MSATYLPPTISSVYLEQLEAQAKEAKDAALTALNQANAARDTALQYRNDAENYYTQVQQIQEGDYVTNLSLAETLAGFNFADLANIPARFEPSMHNHAWSEVINKPTAYPPVVHSHEWAEITGKPSEFEPADHIHTWQQIAQKPGTFPPETHFHSWDEIENKPNVFNPAAHNHSWQDVTGKPTKFEPAAHTHTWDLIENKPLTFPPQSHHHHWSQVTDKPEQAIRWPSYDEVTNKPSLGTASARNAGTASGDVMTVGAFGLGSYGAVNRLSNGSMDSLDDSGLYGVGGSDTGSPSPGAAGNVLHLKWTPSSGVQASQLFLPVVGKNIKYRGRIGGEWETWTTLLTTDNIVSPVAMVGGKPSGGAMERGSNANGEYVKFADGTMICTHTIATSASAEVLWTYPAAFSKLGALTATPLNTLNISQSPRFRAVDNANAELSIFKSDNTRLAAPIVQLSAVGRWY
jgi:hypothetical protein